MVRSGVNGTTSNTNHPTSNATSNHAMRYLVIYLVYIIYMYNIAYQMRKRTTHVISGYIPMQCA